ncbi:hypothetical protein ACWKSP_15130 [Micromonosporaceae bacterium Da 78-11]
MLADLTHLAELPGARARLDDQELTLIDRARHAGATWAQIATALGLASRQAAEQRRHRLAASAQARRQSADRGFAAPIAAVREAIVHLDAWIRSDRRWSTRFQRAELVRSTVTAALEATPGPLYALATHIVGDLGAVRPERLPLPVHAALRSLRTALSTPH